MNKHKLNGISFLAGNWPLEKSKATIIFIHASGLTKNLWMLSEKIPRRPRRRMFDLICTESIRWLSVLTLKTLAKLSVPALKISSSRLFVATIFRPLHNVFSEMYLALSDSSVMFSE